MRKEYIILLYTFIFITFFFKISSSPSTCNSPISIQCSQTLHNLCTATSSNDYYNYTLYTDTDIHIKVDLIWGCYKLTAIWDPYTCESPNNDTAPGGCGTSPEAWIGNLEGSAGGNTYYTIVRGLSTNNCGDSNYFYNLTLECGNWCGNGIFEPTKGEQCDFGSYATGSSRCQSYQYCGSNCRCVNLTVSGCNFYDWCSDGMDPNNPSISCCVNATGNPEGCCTGTTGPVLNCSTVNYQMNPNVKASDKYCKAVGFDATNICVDYNALNHTVRSNCVFA